MRGRVALRLGLHGGRLQRSDSRGRHRDQSARHDGPCYPRRVRPDVRVHARKSSGRRQSHLERALPQRPRAGGREFAGGGSQRRPSGRMHDQRNRRARGQLLDGRSRDGDEDAPRPDGRAVAREHAADLSGVAAALAGNRPVGAGEQTDRRRQCVRARSGNPSGRRAEVQAHVRDHEARGYRHPVEQAGAGQAFGPSRFHQPAHGARASRSTRST